MGSIGGFVHGTGKIDDSATGNLRMYEQVIGAMTSEEKNDPTGAFDKAARQRVASTTNYTVQQV